MYVGSWENNLRHGEGFERFANLSEFKGLYMNDKAEG